MEAKRLLFRTLLPVLLLTFLIFRDEGKIIDYTETWHQFADCFFKIFCELDEGSALRLPVTLASYETIEYTHAQFMQMVPVKVSFTPVDLLNETFLKTQVKYILCNLTETQREKLEKDYGNMSMTYLSDVCTDPLKAEVCKNLGKATAAYIDFYEEKINKGQCHKADEMKDTI